MRGNILMVKDHVRRSLTTGRRTRASTPRDPAADPSSLQPSDGPGAEAVAGGSVLAVYIIATGGAGSFGSPAFESGRRTSRPPSIKMTRHPTRYEGSAKIFGSGHSINRNVAITSPINASPAINPEAVSTPTFSMRAC